MQGYTHFSSAPLLLKLAPFFPFFLGVHIIAQIYMIEMWGKRKLSFLVLVKEGNTHEHQAYVPAQWIEILQAAVMTLAPECKHIRPGNLHDAHHRTWLFEGRAKSHRLSNPPFHRSKKLSLVFSSLRTQLL